MIKIILVILSVVLVAPSSYASEAPDWLYKAIKVDDPNQLIFDTVVDGDCPTNKESFNKITEGVFIRSRIKPLPAKDYSLPPGNIYLDLLINCKKMENGSYIFSLRVMFGRISPLPEFLLFNRSFGSYGFADKESIEDAFKDSVENAITAFIKANFDLWENAAWKINKGI